VVLKLVGAAYLIYLGFVLLRTRRADLALGATSPRSLARLFLDGAFSNLSNPKIAIFLFRLPAAIRRGGQRASDPATAGAGSCVRGAHVLVKGPVGLFAGACRSWLRRRRACCSGSNRSSAWYCRLGLRLALERRSS